MKNVLIITIGTREVQFRTHELKKSGFIFNENGKNYIKHPDIAEELFLVEKNANFPGFMCCTEPRIAGQKILEYWKYFHKAIETPLITLTIEHILINNPIDIFILIYTDQSDLDMSNPQHLRNFSRDTVYFKTIIRKHLPYFELEEYPEGDFDIAVSQRATDIDFQYKQFAVECKSLFENQETINQIFLLPQGGIDQINHALTLQLIQAFGTKVKLWQQSEGKEPNELIFPHLFIEDLNKQKIIKHLHDYDFGFIDKTITQNKILFHLAQYANGRLQLKHDIVKCNLDFLNDKIDDSFYRLIHSDVENLSDKIKIQDLYVSAKIALLHKDYGDFLWRLFTLSENLILVALNINLSALKKVFNPMISIEKENNSWVKFLETISPELPNYLRRNNIQLNNPNRRAYYFMLKFILKENEALLKRYEKIYSNLEKLTRKRNALAHDLRPVKKEDIVILLGPDYGIDGLLVDLDELIGISGYGIFEILRERMLQYLDYDLINHE